MKLEQRKCPNCGAELELTTLSKRVKCQYCRAWFDIVWEEEEKEDKEKKEGEILNSELYYITRDLNKAMEKKNTRECLEDWKYCLDELGTTEAIEDYLNSNIYDGGDVAAEGKNQELLDKVRARIVSDLSQDERVIVMADATIFGSGKEFLIVTDKRCLFYKKKKMLSVNLDDITTIKLDDGLNLPSWLINGSWDMTIPSCEAHYNIQGQILALISLLSFEKNPERHKIRIV